ncbi:MAG: enoyl-CoA hydratase/isomerase family protein [Deltaproteobacteria bacterium]|nr:enoyl-CoA hydratase/isomerase family protein [Deltaproteobacteria bacterium]
MRKRPEYFDRYETIAFDRTESGVLTVRLHTNSGPVVYSSDNHREWVHAFFDISADRDNRVVILTGTGDEFIARFGWDKEIGTAEQYDEIYWEGKRLIRNLLDIEVPVIGAVNGPATIHSELAVLSDITLASETAVFQDQPHIQYATVPGDGIHLIWMELLGPNRGRYFLLTGQKITAQEALQLGVVNEVLPSAELMPRAMELGEKLASLPPLTARYSRVLLTQRLKRLMDESLGYGLALEGLGALGLMSTSEH